MITLLGWICLLYLGYRVAKYFSRVWSESFEIVKKDKKDK